MKKLVSLGAAIAIATVMTTSVSAADYTYSPGYAGVSNPWFSVLVHGEDRDWWTERAHDAIANWNNANTAAFIYSSSTSKNEMDYAIYADTWYGLYTPYYYTSSQTFDHFLLTVNQRSVPMNSEFAQSTFTHELGHALHLIDNPNTTELSLMKHDRDRYSIYTPTAYDKGAVNNYYGNAVSSSSLDNVQVAGEVAMGTIYADYPEYNNLTELYNEADLVVNVTLQNSEVKAVLPNAQYLPYIVSKAVVKEVYKGNVKENDIIDVKQLGDGSGITAQGVQYFQNGDNMILFLKGFEDGPYSLLNPIQAMYNVDSKDTVIARSENTVSFNIAEIQ